MRWSCSLVVLVVAMLAAQHWFVVNTSPSFPLGVYLRTYKQQHKGDLVLACPPDWPVFRQALARRFLSPGFCPSGSVYLIKVLAAEGGDFVKSADAGTWVNGTLLEGSQRKNFQIGGVDLHRVLNASEVLLMSPHPKSFDGRYFGPLDRGTVITTLRPLWVKE